MHGVSEGVQNLPVLLIMGVFTLVAFYLGKVVKKVTLPSLIGYMLTGVLFGNLVSRFTFGDWTVGVAFKGHLSFLTDVVLSFVALTIGMELSFSSLQKQGKGIIAVIFTESFMAFFVVTAAIYLLTKNLPLALIFGSIAPASAPAGTVAIIQEYRAKGPLTKALFAVVGFDDGLGIIIFGFAAAISHSLLEAEAGGSAVSLVSTMLVPLREVVLSVGFGVVVGLLFSFLGRQLKRGQDIFILVIAFSFVVVGLSEVLHLSLILTNMIVGMVVVNTQPRSFVHMIAEEFSHIMPLMYILFFTLAGANLHLNEISALGWIGLVYILGRSFGLVAGARLGSIMGKMPDNIRKYLGMGILSQAGVAIGLALMVKKDFADVPGGAEIGVIVLTTVTASSIIFEIVGPILTKIALTKAGEIEGDTK